MLRLAAVVLMLSSFNVAQAAIMTLSATTSQATSPGIVYRPGHTFPVTKRGMPFDFGSQSFSTLVSIDHLSITLRLDDGDTAASDFDHNDIHLLLDGIDTGIQLNNFPNYREVTRTITGTPDNANEILHALYEDGQLVASLVKKDNGLNYFGRIQPTQTRLTLTGEVWSQSGNANNTTVPEPTSLVILSLGLVATGGVALRQRRKVTANR